MEERLPAPPARPAVPWTALHLVLVFLVGYTLDLALYLLLGQLGWFEWLYGVDWPTLSRPAQPGDTAGQIVRLRTALWVFAVGPLLKLAAAITLVTRSTGASLADLGLTRDRLGRQALLGLLLAVALTPGAYAIFQLMLLLIEALGGSPQEHAFSQLGQAGLMPVEWGLLLFAAVVAAPLWEELFYRGLVQPWLLDRQPVGGWMAFGLALAFTAVIRRELFLTWQWPRPVELLPVASLLLLGIGYALLAARSLALAGVFATAVLFAWVHLSAWPAPVPLVWLAVGLGWVAYRARSLAAPIVTHAVFNAVASAALIWQASRTAGGG